MTIRILVAFIAGLVGGFLLHAQVVWLRRKPTVQPERPRPQFAPAFVQPPVLHLIVHPEDRPLCGASIREPWTEDPKAATCPACRRPGDAMQTQWRANTR